MKDREIYRDPETGKKRMKLTESKDLSTCEGAQECAQRVEAAIKLIRGSWAWDTTKGIPLFDEVFRKHPNSKVPVSYFRTAVSELDGIQSVETVKLEAVEGRRRKLYIIAVHESGEIIKVES